MKKKEHTDICYIYEENPLVGRTGDSVFVRQLARDFPKYQFQVAKISNTASEVISPDQNTVPNILSYQTIDLSFHGSKGKGRSSVSFRRAGAFFHSIARAVEAGKLDGPSMNDLFDSAAELAPKVKFDAVWKNPTSWELIKAVYGVTSGEIPFVEHRELLAEVIEPVWRLLSKWADLPKAKIYQADSGIRSALLAMVASRQHGAKYVIVDDCLPLNALERERRAIKLRDGGVWRPEYEAYQSARNEWTQKMRNHCLSQADEILANTLSSATKIRDKIGSDRPIRIIREGIEGETARRWGAYYSRESEEIGYRIVFLVGSYQETTARGIVTAIQKIESSAGHGKFVILSLSSITERDQKSFDTIVKANVTSSVRLTTEINMIQEIARATVVAFPSQIEVGDRAIINSLHAGKPVVVSMVDGDSIFADPRLSMETDCFATPNRLEGREFPNAIISLIRRKDNLAYHPRRLGEALFNHREIMEGYAKVFHSLSSLI